MSLLGNVLDTDEGPTPSTASLMPSYGSIQHSEISGADAATQVSFRIDLRK